MDTLKRTDYNCIDGTKSYFYVTALGCVVSVALVLIFMLASSFSGVNYSTIISTQPAIYVCILASPIMFITYYIVYHKRSRIELWTKQNINWIYVCVSVAFAAICIFAVAPITNWICVGLEGIGINMESSLTFEMNNWWQIVLGLIGYALLPAIAEELVYRRLILKGLLSKHTAISAIVVTSLLFTIMHGSITQFFYQLILGFVLTLLAYVTGHVMYSMIAHFVNNLIVVILSITGGEFLVAGDAISANNATNIVLYLIIAIAGLAVITGITYLIYKHNKQSSDSIIVSEKLSFVRRQTREENVYFFLGLIIAISVWITNTITTFV